MPRRRGVRSAVSRTQPWQSLSALRLGAVLHGVVRTAPWFSVFLFNAMDTIHVVYVSVQVQQLETMSIHTSALLTARTLPLVKRLAARPEKGLSGSWYVHDAHTCTFNRICHMGPARHSCVAGGHGDIGFGSSVPPCCESSGVRLLALDDVKAVAALPTRCKPSGAHVLRDRVAVTCTSNSTI